MVDCKLCNRVLYTCISSIFVHLVYLILISLMMCTLVVLMLIVNHNTSGDFYRQNRTIKQTLHQTINKVR